MTSKSASKRGGLLGLGLMGLILVLGNGATASSQWFEVSYNDFNGSDTISGLEIKAAGPQDIGKVHLEDNSSESHSNIYNDPTTHVVLCDDPNVNPPQIGQYSQSFSPTIDRMIDKVEVMIYSIGSPFHTIPGEGVTSPSVTIKIQTATASYFPTGGASICERSVCYNYFPTQSGTWTTFWFSYCDSTGGYGLNQNALPFSQFGFTVVISSNADWDPNRNNEIRMEYKVSNNANTKSGERYYNQGALQWREANNGGNAFDFPFNITVHDFISSGYLISNVYNTNNPVTILNSIQWGAGGIAGVTSIHIYTRGGGTSTPDQTWSSWLEQTNFWGSLNPSTPSPHGQYLQYKLELASTDNCYTPFFDHVLIYYT